MTTPDQQPDNPSQIPNGTPVPVGTRPLNPDETKELKKRFTYHAPKPGQPEIYAALRSKGEELAALIMATVPVSREQSTAITKVEEAIFWANAGIARNQ